MSYVSPFNNQNILITSPSERFEKTLERKLKTAAKAEHCYTHQKNLAGTKYLIFNQIYFQAVKYDFWGFPLDQENISEYSLFGYFDVRARHAILPNIPDSLEYLEGTPWKEKNHPRFVNNWLSNIEGEITKCLLTKTMSIFRLIFLIAPCKIAWN